MDRTNVRGRGRAVVAGVVSAVAAGLFGGAAQAAPYASGVQFVSPTQVSFVLNEPTDVLAVSVNGGAPIFLDGSTKGTKSFNVGSATDTFKIYASKSDTVGYRIATGGTVPGGTDTTGANRLSAPSPEAGHRLISNDSDTLVKFNSPRGLDVSKDPNASNFGTAYISNSATGTSGGRSLGDGLYAIKADQSDAYGYGNTASDPGNRFDGVSASANSPFRVTVGPAGEVYVADFSDANANVWRLNPAMTASDQLLAGVGGPTALPAGQNHGSTTSVYAEGTLAGGNLKLYTIDEDLTSAQFTTGGSTTDKNSLWQYNVGGTAPSSVTPTKVAGPLLAGATTTDFDRGADGKFYMVQRRDGTNNEASLFVVAPDGSSVLYDSLSDTRSVQNNPTAARDILQYVVAMAVSPDQKWIAMLLNGNDIAVVPLVNGIPDLGRRMVIDTPVATISGRDIAFDAAGNLHYVSSGQQLYHVLAPGGTTAFTTSYNGSSFAFAASASISLTSAAVAPNGGTVVVTGADGSYAVVDPAVPGAPVTVASFAINDIGGENGSLLALLDLSGTGDLAALAAELGLAGVTVTVNPGTPGWAAGLGGEWDLLLSIPNPTGGGANNFLNVDLGGSGFTIARVAAIPEPATLSVLGLGAAAAMGRRRRRA